VPKSLLTFDDIDIEITTGQCYVTTITTDTPQTITVFILTSLSVKAREGGATSRFDGMISSYFQTCNAAGVVLKIIGGDINLLSHVE